MGLKQRFEFLPGVGRTRKEKFLMDKVEELSNENIMYKNSTTRSPDRPNTGVRGDSGQGGLRVPDYSIPLKDIDYIHEQSDILGSVRQTIRSELFKEGFHAVPRNQLDHIEDEIVGEPDEDEKIHLLKEIRDVNRNGQHLRDVAKEVEDDLEKFDTGYVFVTFKYIFHPTEPKVVDKNATEVLAGDPLQTRIVANDRGEPARNDQEEKLKFCPEHRTNLVIEREHEEKDMCPRNDCGCPLFDAYYASSADNYIGSYNNTNHLGSGEAEYYAQWEVLHASKYEPSKTYGFPQTIKVFNKALTLMREDEYLRNYFGDETPGKKFMEVRTDSPQSSFQKAWKFMKKLAEKNPFIPAPLITPNKDTEIKIHDLVDSLDELQFTSHRKEFRNVISTTYNVQPVFSGDTNSGAFDRGGQSDIEITEKAIREGSQVWNEKLLPKITELAFGVDDYVLQLKQPDLDGELEKLEVKQAKAEYARKLKKIGVEIEDFEDGEFEFSMPEDGINSDDMSGEAPRDAEDLEMELGSDSPFSDKSSTCNKDDPCWDGYEQVGMKPDPNGEGKVPNCVPIDDNKEDADIPDVCRVCEDKVRVEGRFRCEECLEDAKKKVSKRRPTDAEDITDKHISNLQDEVEDLVGNASVSTDSMIGFSNDATKLINEVQETVRENLNNAFDEVWEEMVNDVESANSWSLDQSRLDRKKENLRSRTVQSEEVDDALQKLRTSVLGKFQGDLTSRMNNGIVDTDELIREFEDNLATVTGNVSNIFRTELAEHSSNARFEAYRQAEEEFEQEFNYKWAGPSDHRTTIICSRIKSRIPEEGVSLEKLEEIVEEESMDEMSFPVPHYGCRHQPIRVVGVNS